MAKNHARRSSRAATEPANDPSVDFILDDEPTEQMDDALPDGLLIYGDLPELLLEPHVDMPAMLADDQTADDLDSIAAGILAATPSDAETITVVPSAGRFNIGYRAARIMRRHGLGTNSTAVMIGNMLERRSVVYNVPVPRVWRDLVNLDHAIKCWVPGTCDSITLPNVWPSARKRPFYRLPDYVVKRIQTGVRGYDHGGMVCDYWSRIHPGKLDRVVCENFDQLTTRDDQRAFLRELLARD